MADIFISYKREDRARVAVIARRLEQVGYTVWWDLELIVGQRYDTKIKDELDAARAVIVVWSANSVAPNRSYVSEWVAIEADEGAERRALAPVLLDAGRIAWSHKKLQYANLTTWDGTVDHPGFLALLEGIAPLAGQPVAPSADELSQWDIAGGANSAEGFRQFLSRHPASRFAEIAQSRVGELEEAAAWANCGSEPNADQLRTFLARYPKGRYCVEASARLRRAHVTGDLAPVALQPLKLQPRPARALRLEWVSAQGPGSAVMEEARAALAAQGHTLVDRMDAAPTGVDGCIWAPSKGDGMDGGRVLLTLYARRAFMPVFAWSKDAFENAGIADETHDNLDAMLSSLSRRRVFAAETQPQAPGRVVFFWGDGDHRLFDLPQQIRSHGLYGVFVSPSTITLCVPQRAGLTAGGAVVTLAHGAQDSALRIALAAEAARSRASFVLLSERFLAQPSDSFELLNQTAATRVVFVEAPVAEGEADEPSTAPAPPASLVRPGMRTIKRAMFRDRSFLALLKTRADLDWLDANL